MDRDEYQRMTDAADRHWWYAATRDLLEQVAAPHLRHAVDGSKEMLLLDAAGGNGGTGRWMATYGTVVTTDLEPSVLAAARASVPGSHAVVADLNAMPHPDGRFDLALCVTALCHRLVPDPAHVVRELARVTRPGGLVLLMEPGVRRLRRGHDAVTHTARRFSRGDLVGLLEGAGLDVLTATGAYSFLVPLAAVMALVERGTATSDVGRHQDGGGGVLPRVARLERAVLRHATLPVGLSVVALGRVPDVRRVG